MTKQCLNAFTGVFATTAYCETSNLLNLRFTEGRLLERSECEQLDQK